MGYLFYDEYESFSSSFYDNDKAVDPEYLSQGEIIGKLSE